MQEKSIDMVFRLWVGTKNGQKGASAIVRKAVYEIEN